MMRPRWLLLVLLCAVFSLGSIGCYSHYRPKPEHYAAGILESNRRNPVENSVFSVSITPVTAGKVAPCCPKAFNALDVTVTNLSGEPIKILWNKSTFSSPEGRNDCIILTPGKADYGCADAKPEKLGPGKTVRRTVFPTDEYRYWEGDLWNTPFLGEITLRLAVESGEQVILEHLTINVTAASR